MLRICDDLYDLHAYPRPFVVSIGKAGHTMVQALAARTGDQLEGIVVCPEGAQTQLRGFRYFRGGHPTPNSESVRAAEAILKSLSAQNASSLVIYLLSGGGSSMAEKPLDDEITLEDLIATYRALVLSGAPIAEINAIRKRLIAIKAGTHGAGRLSGAASFNPDLRRTRRNAGCARFRANHARLDHGQRLSAHRVGAQSCRGISEICSANCFSAMRSTETPKSDDPAFVHSRWWTCSRTKLPSKKREQSATSHGFAVEIDNSCDDWDYERAANYLLDRVRELRKQVSRVCLISGGEVTVKVSNGGTGGRNQQFALACAAKTAGEDLAVLSAGTDGVDGNSPAAGAVVDGSTLDRAQSVVSMRTQP